MSSSSTSANRRGGSGRGGSGRGGSTVSRRPDWAVRPATPVQRGTGLKTNLVNGIAGKSDENGVQVDEQDSEEDDDDPMFASIKPPPVALVRPQPVQSCTHPPAQADDDGDDESSEDELLTTPATFAYNSRRQPSTSQPASSSATSATSASEAASNALMDHVTARLGTVRVSSRPTRAALAKPAPPPAAKPTPAAASSKATEVVELLDSDSDSDSPSTTMADNPYLATRPLSLTYHRFPTPFSLSPAQLSQLIAFHKHLVSSRPRPPAQSLLNIVHNKFNITLDSLYTLLSPGGWLNDELINAYLALAHARLPDERRRKVILLSTFFYTTLANHGYDRVKRWVKRAVLAGDVACVLVPVNFGNRHWAFACVWVDGADRVEVGVYDSMPSEVRSASVGRVLGDWIRSERRDPEKRAAYGGTRAAPPTVKVNVSVPACPEQDDGSSCGVFTVVFGVWVMAMRGRGEMPGKVFGQSKQVGMRRRMAFELCGIGRGREEWEDSD